MLGLKIVSWNNALKNGLARLKPYLRWVFLGVALFFIGSALSRHWGEVASIRLTVAGYGRLAIALLITLLAHTWSGWVWSWILQDLNQAAIGSWGIRVYLRTNIAKYLPGNVWHFYGRVMAAKQAGFSVAAATLSVVLESLLMAAAAVAIALSSGIRENGLLQAVGLAIVLIGVHPRFLNPLIKIASKAKGKSIAAQSSESQSAEPRLEAAESPVNHLRLQRYPLRPLLGEAIFVLLRGTGFAVTLSALGGVAIEQVPQILSAFSFAWVLGLVVPGAPGGIGVFEATAIALLSAQISPGLILAGVALYRLVSILAELTGAGMASLSRN
ncbi:MAG: lysylphosphatidylglycerol synthase domain-containing protein [Oculatellaceae cyanobacterium Prado106]|nr:lysylphosphatidylglycerol synthase domain-containing protein [Oculatellaceae cyanobacterium Prado106]